VTAKRRAAVTAEAMRRGVLGATARTTGVSEDPASSDPVSVAGVERSSAEGEQRGGQQRMSKYTALLDPATAEAFDELALRARRVKGRRVEKSEIMRVLITLAADDASLRDQVIGQLPDESPARNVHGTR